MVSCFTEAREPSAPRRRDDRRAADAREGDAAVREGDGAGRDVDLDVSAGRGRLASGAFRLRQDDAASGSPPALTCRAPGACCSTAARWRRRRVFVPPEKRRIGLMFQDYALFPHLTVLRNVMFGLTALDREARAGGGACRARPRRAGASRRVLSARDLGRRAAARGARARDRAAARRAADGRAVLRPRQPAEGQRARGHAFGAARGRRDGGPRHARSGGGDAHQRPHRA